MPEVNQTTETEIVEGVKQEKPQGQPAPMPPQPQDLHISRPALPDRAWARMKPIQLVPSKERLDAPHQTVSIKNTSDTEPTVGGIVRPQLHIVVDRHQVGHEIQAGQTITNVEMLVSEIESFNDARRPDRLDPFGFPKPKHPILILGIKPPEGRTVRRGA